MPREYIKTIRTRSTEGWTRDIPLNEGFEDAKINWRLSLQGTGTIALDTTKAYKGNQSAKLTTDATSYNRVEMIKSIHSLEPDIIRLSTWINNHNNLANAIVLIYIYTSTRNSENQQLAQLKIEFDASRYATISIIKNDGMTYQQIDTGILWQSAITMWSPIELDVDLRNSRYLTLRIDQKIYDIKQYTLYTSSSAYPIENGVNISLQTTAAASKTINIDEVTVEYI
jgi:hypothetical protein